MRIKLLSYDGGLLCDLPAWYVAFLVSRALRDGAPSPSREGFEPARGFSVRVEGGQGTIRCLQENYDKAQVAEAVAVWEGGCWPKDDEGPGA